MMLKQNEVQQNQQNSLNSSTSSYSETFPREQIIQEVRKDKPIIMRSIPVSKNKQTSQYSLSQKNISYTLINSTHANSNLQRSQFSVEVNKNQIVIENIERLNSDSVQKKLNQTEIKRSKYNSNQNMHDDKSQNNRQQIKKYLLNNQNENSLSNATFNNSPSNATFNYSISSASSQRINENVFNKYGNDLIFQSGSNILSKQSGKKDSQQMKQTLQQSNNEFKQKQVQFYINAIKQIKKQQQKKEDSPKKQNIHIQALLNKIHTLQNHIVQMQNHIQSLESQLKNDSQSIIIQRKANQVYAQFYQSLQKIIAQFTKRQNTNNVFPFSDIQHSQTLNESLNMERIIQIVQKMIQSHDAKQTLKKQISKTISQQKSIQVQISRQQINRFQSQKSIHLLNKIQQLNQLLQIAEQNNSNLKKQLLQSTQNNISAIFNTQISASCCLENQVQKINNQMSLIKQKMNFLTSNNKPYNTNPVSQPQIIYIPQQSPIYFSQPESKQVKKIVKIYTNKDQVNQSSDSSEIQEHMNKKRQHSLSQRKRKGRNNQRSVQSSSSLSSKSTKKRQQISKKQLQNLKQAYNQTKQQLNSLLQTFAMINNQQRQMKGYFNQIREDLINNINQKMKQNSQKMKKSEENILKSFYEYNNKGKMQHQKKKQEMLQQYEKNKEKQFKRRGQQTEKYILKDNNEKIKEIKQEQQRILKQKIKQNQANYLNQIQFIKSQRQQDRKVIQRLNNKMIQLITAISVPQKVIQQEKNKSINEDEIPTSQISISVDYLRLIDKLKLQKDKQSNEIQSVLRQNQFLRQEVTRIKVMQERSTSIKNITHYSRQKINESEYSINQSRQRKQSIIHQLNGFTEMSISPPLLINTGSNYIMNQRKKKKSNQGLYTLSNKQISFNKIANQNMLSLRKIDSQQNIQSNFKIILNSKENHIKHLEQEVLDLEQANQYFKRQIQQKEKSIQDLQIYIATLQNKSTYSISLSAQGGNLPLQNNIYLDAGSPSESIRAKYENYVKNLKILLKQTRNQNKILREQVLNFEMQTDQLTQSDLRLKNSATHSQRTTKNCPNSSSPRTSGEVLIRRRIDISQKIQSQRQQQRINSLAFDQSLPFALKESELLRKR